MRYRAQWSVWSRGPMSRVGHVSVGPTSVSACRYRLTVQRSTVREKGFFYYIENLLDFVKILKMENE